MKTRRTLVLLIALSSMTAVGCATDQPTIATEKVASLASMDYPLNAKNVENLDIIVRRKGTHVALTNRTANNYENMYLWLNQMYVAEPVTVAIGPDNRYDLRTFVSEHRRSFPIAGFLAPDKAFPVVLAELYDPATDTRYRLTADRDPAMDTHR